MQYIGLMVSDDLRHVQISNRHTITASDLNRVILKNCTDQALIFSVFVQLVTHLSHDVINLVPKFDEQLVGEQTVTLFHPDQLNLMTKNTHLRIQQLFCIL